MKILVQKFGGTSVTEERRASAVAKVIKAMQHGWKVVVVVSAMGREGAPYATDTLINALYSVDKAVPPAAREQDMIMACGEIISTVLFAQALRARGYESVALTGGQAGIRTNYEFGNARIEEINPHYILRMLEEGKVVVVAGFQGTTAPGAITTLGRGGSDTSGSALGAALKPHATEIEVEIYTDVDGVKTADPRVFLDKDNQPLPNLHTPQTLRTATYQEVAEMAHMGAKVVHPRAAEIAHQYHIPLWVKSTFEDAPGTLITKDDASKSPEAFRVTGVTNTGKLAYLRFELPAFAQEDRTQIELHLYKLLQQEHIPLYLNSIDGCGFAFAISREHLIRLREMLDGLVIPINLGGPYGGSGAQSNSATRRRPPYGRVYLLGLGITGGMRGRAYQTQKELLKGAADFVEVHDLEADVTENCTVVSVIANRFQQLPGVMAQILRVLHEAGVMVYQTADSAYSVSALVPEDDAKRAVRALHEALHLGEGA
jgi:aspartate kinase